MRRAIVVAHHDPDGIVVEASFVPPERCGELLASGAPWASEPLSEWLRDRWAPATGIEFHYDVFGASRADLRFVRANGPTAAGA